MPSCPVATTERHRKPSLAILALCLLISGCTSSPDRSLQGLTNAVDPSLRAAAMAAESNHDYQGAIQHLSTLYQHHRENREIAIALARNLRYAGQGQTAADLMQTTLAEDARNPDLLLELGKDYLAADRISLAAATLTRARDAAPDRWEILSTLAVALDTEGHSAEARTALTRANELAPDNPVVLNNLALSEAVSGHLDKAIEILEHAVDLPSATAQTRENLALLLAMKGDTRQAEKLDRHDLSEEMTRANTQIFQQWAKDLR
ncbi:MAG: tetratricopeptide repeat protein [Alphaproteobacteria bacterium]|nr:tetratricopeptide repeat protein [Alphaproteobacteria bacterium]